MSRLKIGVPAWNIGPNSFGVGLSYIQYIERFGEPVILMPDHEVREDLDLLLLSGGADVDAQRYNEIPGYQNGKPNIFLENFDHRYLRAYVDNGTPIFGICRGHQTLAVHFGGKLIQDMNHETNTSVDPYKEVHKAVLTNNAMLIFRDKLDIKDLSIKKLKVNSRHHQTVDYNTCIRSFIEGAIHENDGENEMLLHRFKPIASVQWHPEDVFDANSTNVVDRMIEYLIKYRKPLVIGDVTPIGN
jgi:putative glutamine amidotransferase